MLVRVSPKVRGAIEREAQRSGRSLSAQAEAILLEAALERSRGERKSRALAYLVIQAGKVMEAAGGRLQRFGPALSRHTAGRALTYGAIVNRPSRMTAEQAAEWADRGRDVLNQQKEQFRSAYEAGRQAYHEATVKEGGPAQNL